MTMLPVTLWHGTSGHLLTLIEQHGLGGMDVMESWRVLPFLKWAFPKLQFDDRSFGDDDFLDLLSIRAAVNGGAAGMNFVYGDVYAAGGLQKASTYAQTAPELLSFVRTVVKIADRRGLALVRTELGGYPEIDKFLRLDPKPVVLELSAVPMSSVTLERGGALSSSLFENDSVSQISLAQTGFRICANIPFSDIKVLEL